MNQKQLKRIRKRLRLTAAAAGLTGFHEGDRQLNAHAVDSRKYKLTNNETGETTEGKALQWRLDPNCPRGLYRRVKERVSTIRKQGRSRFLLELRGSGGRGAAESVEHARAASIQRQYEAVSRVQGLGLQDSEEGEGSDTRELRVPDVSGTGEGSK